MSRYFNINILVETLSLLAAVFFLWNERDRGWKWHPWYLALVLLTELGGLYIRFIIGSGNQWWYNLYLPVAALFLSTFLYKQVDAYRPVRALWLFVWQGTFAGVFISEMVCTDMISTFNYVSSTYLDFSILSGCFVYYILLMRGPAIPQLVSSAAFWWVFGVCNYFFAHCVFDLNVPILNQSPYWLWGMPLAQLINYTLNIIFYSTWILSCYLRYSHRRQERHSSFTY